MTVELTRSNGASGRVITTNLSFCFAINRQLYSIFLRHEAHEATASNP
jgi:hypothetical protein